MAMTEWCWGFGCGAETIDPKTRSMMHIDTVLTKINDNEIIYFPQLLRIQRLSLIILPMLLINLIHLLAWWNLKQFV